MRTFLIIGLAVTALSMPVQALAGNGIFLPQNPADLMPTKQTTLPAPAPQVRVDIPKERVLSPSAKSNDVIRVSMGQSRTITLNEDAASVVVANPAHATVYLDNPRTLIVMPRASGATSFTVLDRSGKVIIDQPIVVNDSDNNKYVRVTRICGSTQNCQPSSTYFCPDNCVPVSTPQVETAPAYPTIPPIAALPPLPVENAGVPASMMGNGTAAQPVAEGMN